MNEVISGSYDLRLVALSFTIAAIASYTALDLAGRVTPTSSQRLRLIWILGGAIAMGTGIWSMHFIAMLAFKLPVPVSYDVPTTFVSWIVGIVASGVALLLFSRPQLNLLVLLGGSAIMGLAIASMHYIGMAAVKVPAAMQYHPKTVALSIAIAIGASGAALGLAFRFRNPTQAGINWLQICSALVMGIAISGMHYTGMWATCFVRVPALENAAIENVHNSWLAIQIGIGTLIILIGTLLTSLFDRRYAAQLVRQESLQESENRFRSLIREMPVGVLLLDAEGNIILSNPVAIDWLDLTERELKNGNAFNSNWQILDEEGKPFAEQIDPIRQAIAHRQPLQNQLIGVNRPSKKDTLWLLLNVDLQLDEDGTIERVVCTFTNISDRKQAQEALIESETRFALAVEGASVGIWDWDLHSDRIYLSPRWKSMLGYEDWELPNTVETCQKIIHPEDMERVKCTLNAYLQNHISTYEIEFRAGHKNGSYRWIFARGTALRDERGKPYRLSGSHTDITERKKAEQALRESQARLAKIIDRAEDAIISVDHTQKITLFNRAAEKIFGYPAAEVLDRPLDLLIPERFASIHRQHIRQFNEPLITHNMGQEREIMGRRKDGTEFSIEVSLSQLELAGGKVYTAIVRDITHRKQAAKALRESADRERAIAKAIERMRQTLDLDTIFKATTQELRQVLNCDRVGIYRFNPDWSGEFVAEAVGKSWVSLVRKQKSDLTLTEGLLEDRACVVKAFSSDEHNTIHSQPKILQTQLNELVRDTYLQENAGGIYTQGAAYRVVQDIYKADFSHCYINILERFQARAYIIVPIFCGNKLWGLLASYQNSGPRCWSGAEINVVVQIGTQLGVALQQAELFAQTQEQSAALEKAAIAADAANRAKSEFLAKMSHELRTPLNAIIGFTQVMNRDSSLSPEHKEHLGIINRAGEHLLELINDILEMSKIEAGQILLNPNNFDLYRLLNHLKEMFGFKASSKNLQLIFECAPEVPQYVRTDEGKLRQVLMNILGNAIKFTQKGGVMLRVTVAQGQSLIANGKASAKNTEPLAITFEISDTGPGIAPEELNKLFQPFVQTETGRKSQQGTGLGLPISQKFVEMMGGEFTVTSDRSGSTFAFDIRIDRVEASEIEIAQPKRKVISVAPNQPEYRILVAEDVRANRMVLVKLLTAVGFSVQEAENGREAVALWHSWQPHLIWMDMQMPVMDGYEATQEIKAHPQGKATAIIALTASAFEEERKEILGVGCDDFVRKPFEEHLLLAMMEKHLGVRYLYEEPPAEANTGALAETVPTNLPIASYLSQMPAQWVSQIHQAASECSDDRIFQLMKEIPAEKATLAKALTDLAHNFLFDEIITLTKQVRN